MPVNTYRGGDLAALMQAAQQEFGDDAVILRTTATRTARGTLHELVAGDAEGIAELRRREFADRTAGAPQTPLLRKSTARRDRATDVLAFVGPTGAGKTTTVAKLAGNPAVFGRRRVGLLCLDTYRVGAVDQLAQHADVAGLPWAVSHEAADLGKALKALSSAEVILVDCPGRGPRQNDDLKALQEQLRRLEPTEVHCAIPAGLRTEHAKRIIEVHRRLGLTHLVATKLDEYPDDWGLFDLAVHLNLPMRWLTDGQAVPQDVRSAAARLDAARSGARGIARTIASFEGVA